MKKLQIALVMGALVAAAQISASAMTVTVDRVYGYYAHDGGEFNISPVGGTQFSSDVIVNNRYGNAGYESFCMEIGENVTVPGTYSAYVSQTDDKGNALTLGVAYLYSQFVGGTLSGYDYADHTSAPNASPLTGRAASAWALQNAIWYLQGENDAAHTTANEQTIGQYYIDLVNGKFTDATVAANGAYSVSILNLYNGKTQYQSQLSVPDGGSTAMLLGLTLGVFGLISRKLKRA